MWKLRGKGTTNKSTTPRTALFLQGKKKSCPRWDSNPQHCSLGECSTNWATRVTQLAGVRMYNTIACVIQHNSWQVGGWCRTTQAKCRNMTFSQSLPLLLEREKTTCHSTSVHVFRQMFFTKLQQLHSNSVYACTYVALLCMYIGQVSQAAQLPGCCIHTWYLLRTS